LTRNGFVKIKKLEFDLNKAIKQIEKLKTEKLLAHSPPGIDISGKSRY
jgi:hypothetical protein